MAKAGKGVILAKGRYKPRHIISTSMFIRDHLLEVVEDYPFHMWRLFKDVKVGKVGSYQNFRNFIYRLVKLGLIKFVREEPSQNPYFQPRRYYTYIPENIEKIELWRNTLKALYPESWWKHHYKGVIPPLPPKPPAKKKVRKKRPPKKKRVRKKRKRPPKVLKRKPREEVKTRKERLVLLKTEEAYKKKLAEGWTFVEMIDGNYLMKPSD